MYTWINALTLVTACVALLAAAAIDRRTLRIPNWLTFPLILTGLALLPMRCDITMAGLTYAVSYAFVYGLWKCRLWGGGDAKLVLALYLLVSPVYPPLYYIAAYSLCLAAVLFLKHAIWGRTMMLQGYAPSKGGPMSAEDIASLKGVQGPMGPALLVAYVLSIAALTAVQA